MVGTCKLSGCGRPALSLHGAAANDNLAAIESLIAAGAEVNARDEGGLTPLHRAAWPNDNPAIIGALVAAGAEVNARGGDGLTPLHVAATATASPAIIEALLDAGADATARDAEGKTPWDYDRENEALRGTDAWWRLREGGLD